MGVAGTRLVDADTGEAIVPRLEIAANPWTRFVGLMGRPTIDVDSALLLEPCNQIHMFFMRFAIDVLFLDRSGRVKRVMLNLKPWRISPLVFGARSVVELPAGTLSDHSLEGRRLRVE
ncbi:MAG TPA: DUF192 domain-containing protein [Candidatus Dormibacteraeota bacterium]|jgi:hypothetical protein|nr:DUF192 domain-containing protein [Candidatus Dormibacteraeota bacterium]